MRLKELLFKKRGSIQGLVSLVFVMLFVATAINAQAQNFTIKGNVKDVNGMTVPGATVSVVGKEGGTITDIDGNFTLLKNNKGDVVEVNFLGYKTYRFTITSQTEVKVVLKEDQKLLEEIVVIGYGEQKKEDLTGSISRVSGKEVARSNNASFENELQGKMSGVRVVSNSGQPGASSSINIRGVASIGGNNRPLYVIDGVPINSDDNTGFSANAGNGQSAMANINPADIKSIEVLKDASSTAIYGSMGSNGVILITTKQGEVGNIKTNVSTKYGVQQLASWMYADVLNTKDYLTLRNQAGRLSQDNLEAYLSSGSDTIGTDWQKEMYKLGYTFDANASISGGTKKFNFYSSVNYYDAKGIIAKSGFQRVTFRGNVNSQITDKLRFSSSIYMSNSDAGQVNSGTGFDASKGQGSVVFQGLRTQPTLMIDGTNIIDNGNNAQLNNSPLDLVDMNNMQNLTNVLVGNLSLDYNIGKGFAWTTRFGMNNVNRENNFYRATNKKNPVDATRGWARRRFSAYSSWNLDNQLRYYQRKNKFTVNALLMSSLRGSQDTWSSQEAQNFPSDDLMWNNMGAGISQLSNQSGYSMNRLMSFTFRSIMSYDNRYFLTLSERIDGASKFSKGNKWASFPAVSASWKLNNESFLKDVSQINLLKLRASYGTNGSPANRAFQSLDIYYAYYGIFGKNEQRVAALREAAFTNDELKWELTKELNFGLDVELYKSRISLTTDYFLKNTDDLLLFTAVPAYTGFKDGLLNIGSIQNRGLEFALNTVNIEKSDFTWSSNYIFTNTKTYISDLNVNMMNAGYNNPWTTGSYTQRLIEGKELGTFWGLQSDGIYQYSDFKEFRGMTTEEAAQKYKADLETARYNAVGLRDMYTPWKESDAERAIHPGQIKYKDLNGDGKIDSNDFTEIGNAQPDFVWSVDNKFEYKNFALSIFFMGEQGRQMANLTNWQLGFLNGSSNTTQEMFDNRWTPDNPTQDTHIALISNNQTTVKFSDKVIEDASFIRLKRIEMMYRFVRKKLNLVATFSVNDIYTWTNYSGYNPDVSLTGHNALQMGHDYGIYPLPVSYNVGLNITIK